MKKFNLEDKKQIVEAVHHAELETSGDLRVHVSYAPVEKNVMKSAKYHFALLGMHRTPERNGMLLYINPEAKKFAVFGDKGIHKKVGQEFWDHLSKEVSAAIREKDIVTGIVHAVEKMGHALKTHFPAKSDQKHSLPDDVSES